MAYTEKSGKCGHLDNVPLMLWSGLLGTRHVGTSTYVEAFSLPDVPAYFGVTAGHNLY